MDRPGPRAADRPEDRLTTSQRVAILATAMTAVVLLSAPSPAAACIGNMDLGWAVAHSRRGIAQGRIVEAVDTTYGIRVRLEAVTRVVGQPPLSERASLMMGDVCDQSADPGDTVWLMYDLSDWLGPTDLAIAFVVEGPDAVSHQHFRSFDRRRCRRIGRADRPSHRARLPGRSSSAVRGG